jgi:hypothetical protein
MYWDVAEQITALGVPQDRSGLFAWVAGATTYSKITGAPGATCLAPFDNYLLLANIQDDTGTFPQRVQWCDRGSLSSWTGGLSGFEDLLAAPGGVNRLVPLEDRVMLFFDDQIWSGTLADFPNVFRFTPFDATIGSPYPRSVTVTPRGVLFMARNFQLHLLPKGGGAPTPVGQPIHRSIRSDIVQAARAVGVYDGLRNHYQFHYAASGDSGEVPHRSVWLNLDTATWAPQSFATAASADIGITAAFQANLVLSKLTTWDQAIAAWDATPGSWDDMRGLGNERQSLVLGASGGTMYELRSDVTRDDGSPVVSLWESPANLGDAWPGQQKTISEIRFDYAATSASTFTVRARQNAAFHVGQQSAAPASSLSQGIAYPFVPTRYPAIRLESQDQIGWSWERFYVTMRVGGR